MVVSIKDVAKAANVSTATVSRALSEPQKVSDETRKKVLKAVKKTGYVGNILARNFRLRKTNAILVLVPDISNIFFSNIIQGVEKVAHANHYKVFLGDTQYNEKREHNYASLVKQKLADGIISLSRNIPFPIQGNRKSLHPSWPPFVMACEYNGKLNAPTVCIDNEHAAYDAVNYLINKGHTNIAFINGPTESPLCIERRNGYKKALKKAGIALSKEYQLQGDFSMASGYEAIKQFIATKKPLTAVFAASDEMAFGAIKAIKKAGKSVPNEISVIGFDDIHFSEYSDPPLTTIHQPRTEIGESSMKLMLSILNGEKPKENRLILKHYLKERESCQSKN